MDGCTSHAEKYAQLKDKGHLLVDVEYNRSQFDMIRGNLTLHEAHARDR